MEKAKLIVLGSINVDYVLNVDHFPRPGETITGSNYKINVGGKGGNQAVAAARSGASLLFMAAVGEDEIADTIYLRLAANKIDVQLVEIQRNVMTGVAMVFVNKEGENCIGISPGANALLSQDYVKRHQKHIENAHVLLMQLESPLDTIQCAAEIAHQSNTQVILNPAPAKALPDELLSLVDVITPNETEAEQLTGISVKDDQGASQAAEILHGKGINKVIITLGSRGAWLSVAGKGQLIEGFQVKAVDTTGAGDTFNGALATALIEDKSLVDAVKFANAAAAIAVTRHGAQSSVPSREEVDRFLAES